MTSIYLSSTSDLKVYREIISAALQQMGYTLLEFEEDAADEHSSERSRAAIVTCDLYIGIIAWQYGYVPVEQNPEQKSLLELEYQQALQYKKPCLIFLLTEQSNNLTDDKGNETENSKQQSAMRMLRQKFTQAPMATLVHFFRTPEQLTSQLCLAVLDWDEKRAGAEQTLQTRLAHLPDWWRYTLIRCSLKHQADAYPLEAFQTLIQQKRELEALALADSLSIVEHQVSVLLQVARHWSRYHEREEQCHQLLTKAHVIARSIEDSMSRPEALVAVCACFASMQQWERAEAVLRIIKDGKATVQAMGKLAAELIRVGQKKRGSVTVAKALAESKTIEITWARVEALYELGLAVARVLEGDLSKDAWLEAEKIMHTLEHIEEQTEILQKIDQARYNLVIDLMQAQPWLWQHTAEAAASAIHDNVTKAKAYAELFTTLERLALWKQAEVAWRRVEQIVQSIEQEEQRIETLRELAIILTIAQQTERAGAVWARAETATYALTDGPGRIGAIWELGIAQAKVQHWEQAEIYWAQTETLDASFSLGWDNAGSLRKLVELLMRAQQWERAKHIAHSIKNGWIRNETLRKLSTSLAQAQRWQEAYEVIDGIENTRTKAKALQKMGVARAQARQWQEAKLLWMEAAALTRIIEESQVRTEAFCSLGEVLAQAGRWEQASIVWQEAEKMAHLLPEHREQAEALLQLGSTLANSADLAPLREQQMVWANSVWSEAETAACLVRPDWVGVTLLRNLSIELTRSYCWDRAEAVAQLIEDIWAGRAEALLQLVLGLIQAKNWKQAADITYSIKEQRIRAIVLQKLGSVFLSAGQWAIAETVARMITDKAVRARLLCQQAVALTHAQLWEPAEVAWAEAEMVARSIATPYARAMALCELGANLSQTQRTEHAIVLWTEAEMVTQSIETDWLQIDVLQQLGSTLANGQQQEHALAIWQEAVRIARTLKFERDKVEVLGTLAVALTQEQHYEQADLLWVEAEALANTITESQIKAEALSLLVRKLITAQQQERAERIVHSIEEIWACRDLAIYILAVSFMQLRQWEQAETLMLQIKERRMQAEALQHLGGELDNAQQREKALTVLSQAIRVTRHLEPLPNRALAYLKLGKAFAQVGQVEQARVMWSEVVVVVSAIEDQRAKVDILKLLAETLQRASETIQLLHMVQQVWSQTTTRMQALQLFPLANQLLALQAETGMACFEAFVQADHYFLPADN